MDFREPNRRNGYDGHVESIQQIVLFQGWKPHDAEREVADQQPKGQPQAQEIFRQGEPVTRFPPTVQISQHTELRLTISGRTESGENLAAFLQFPACERMIFKKKYYIWKVKMDFQLINYKPFFGSWSRVLHHP